jgi:homoserine kinase
MNRPRQPSFEVRVPASTANLGAGFDCFGLALELFLKVRATLLSGTGNHSSVRSRGVRGSAELARVPEENLIFRALQDTAQREGFTPPPVRLDVYNDIPVASGLGSSAAAIVAGIGLGYALAGRKVSLDAALRLAFELEGHADNAAAALLGGLVVTAPRSDGNILAIRRPWPREIRMVAVTPAFGVETKRARAVLPENVRREAAVLNLQRSALMIAALAEKRFDLLWEAMQDSLHQDCRSALIPGLKEILQMPRTPGLLGVALSGSGPSVVALATDHFKEIGKSIAEQFARHHLASTVRCFTVSRTGLTIGETGRGGRN